VCFNSKAQSVSFCLSKSGTNAVVTVIPSTAINATLIDNISFIISAPAGGTVGASSGTVSQTITGNPSTYACQPCGTVTWAASTPQTVATIPITGDGTFSISSAYIEILGANRTGTTTCSSFLPLSLTTFQAAPLPTAITLDWGSTNELNFSGFEVERSMDGKSFEKIAWVAAKGGVSVAEYKHLDQTAQRGMTYYYRLKMVDNDGIFKYSPVRTARLGEGTINAFPNPSGGQYTIALERTRSAEGTVTVTDVMGKTVKMERRTLDAALTLDLNALPDGVYHVKIDDGAAAQTVRVVKQ
jgi:hypothetical protein